MTIFGEYGKVTQGTMKLEGREMTIKNGNEAMRAGISLVPEDRKRHGLVLIQSILKNISLPNLDRFSSFMRIDQYSELIECLNYAKQLAVKTPECAVTGRITFGRQPAKSRHRKMADVRPESSDHG